MTKSCCVFGCSNRGGKRKDGTKLSFHRLPLGKKPTLKKWLHNMRTSSVVVGSSTMVCGAHFVGGKRSKEHPIPTLFAWSAAEKTRKTPKERVALKTHQDKTPQASAAKPETCESTCEEQPSPSLPSVDEQISEVRTQIQECLEENTRLRMEVQKLTQENEALRVKLEETATVPAPEFSVARICNSDSLTKFYTGIPSYEQFQALVAFLEPHCKGMTLWNGARTGERQRQCVRALDDENSLLLTFMKLRLDCPNEDLAQRFSISAGTVSRIFTSYLMVMYHAFKSAQLPAWPARAQIDAAMPQKFRDLYPTTRTIIDCTEFPIQIPSDPDTQRVTWSTYKNRNTFKALVCITPSGAISFISSLYGGSVSDREITKTCGVLDLLDKGDSNMADKGFTIKELCEERGAYVNIPPFIKNGQQLTEKELVQTRRVASLRVHVERAIERIKNFHTLDFILSAHFDIADAIFLVCCVVADFGAQLIT
ncbi:uncharacterized protein LOC135825183 [Sycon ciliatum]|uniref:uncharacterized protein LOC135825183 n=1 Tax=Sycon ciliatum TaxID=27933 RepID=UPI0031F67D22